MNNVERLKNYQFLSTLSLRRATFRTLRIPFLFQKISIHALLAESDHVTICDLKTVKISIHALLAESDYYMQWDITDTVEFLSTLSLRRATDRAVLHLRAQKHFYPRSPCGERLPHPGSPRPVVDISIHALLAESDLFLP